LARPRVLLVEDDPATLQALGAALREEFSVWVARDGTHALEVAEELGWDADVLVVDLSLGEGPRGDQFVAYYRTRATRETPAIVISGVPRAYEIASTMRAATVLPKPLIIDELLSSVRLFARQNTARN
jgi:DNA-binding response OmpR family regulator